MILILYAPRLLHRRASSVHRQRPIYDRAVDSFTSVIRPNTRVQSFIDKARSELLPTPSASSSGYLAVHMRLGDSRPQSLRYGQQPIPVTEYVTGITQAIEVLGIDAQSKQAPLIVFAASDSVPAIQELRTLQSQSQASPVAWKVISLSDSAYPELRELAYPRLNGYEQSDWHMGGPEASVAADMDMQCSGQWTDEEKLRYMTGTVVDLALLSGLWPTRATDERVESVPPNAVVCGIQYVSLLSIVLFFFPFNIGCARLNHSLTPC